MFSEFTGMVFDDYPCPYCNSNLGRDFKNDKDAPIRLIVKNNKVVSMKCTNCNNSIRTEKQNSTLRSIYDEKVKLEMLSVLP